MPPTRQNMMFLIKDPNNAAGVGAPGNFTNTVSFDNIDYFVPIRDGTSVSSSSTFALFRQDATMYVSGNDNGRRYTQTGSKVTLTESVGINLSPGSQPPGTSNSGSSNSRALSAPVGAIIGLIIVLGLVIGCTVWLIKRDDNRRKKKVILTGASPQEPRHAPTQHLGENERANYCSSAGQNPTATTYPSEQVASTSILPMAPNTSAQRQTFQDQMQALQFSSHPRPNFVTTAAYIGESETSSNASSVPYLGWSGAPQAAWQPTPFILPTRPANSTNVSTPSTSHAPATTTFVTAGTQSSQDPQARSVDGIVDSGATSSSAQSLPLLSSPSIPYNTRPSPGIETCHTLVAPQNHPQD
ncbi:hypothetical protein BG015_003277 [Linnemannia schmuckeri]|uniref:Uncharacterized protein n=1 Tax=Linnemannia schmuckeri TaxID=64567 RepID=A0A9P5S396_9FUNG|nr:hypothetical protein BG015_003277 [Linnemannia schmuckeri]